MAIHTSTHQAQASSIRATSVDYAAVAADSDSDSSVGSIRVRNGSRKDRHAVCRLEMACFGRARMLFGLWWLIGKPSTNLWVAEENGHLLGYVIAYPNELDGQVLPYIGGVGVSPVRRNAGIGAKMMHAAMMQFPQLWLHVRASNAPAIRLYEKLGFVQLKREQQFYSNGEDALILATKMRN